VFAYQGSPQYPAFTLLAYQRAELVPPIPAKTNSELMKFQFTLNIDYVLECLAKLRYLEGKDVVFEGIIKKDKVVLIEFTDSSRRKSFKKDLEQSEEEQVQDDYHSDITKELEKEFEIGVMPN
jgi:hypothetical protein